MVVYHGRIRKKSPEKINPSEVVCCMMMGPVVHQPFQEFANIPLEHTPDPEPTVYEGIPFIWRFGEAWGMLQGYVGVLLETQVMHRAWRSIDCVRSQS